MGVTVEKLRRLADVLRKHQFIPPASLDQVADELEVLAQQPAQQEPIA